MTWTLQTDHVHNWAYEDSVFTPEECAKIIGIGNQKLQDGKVYGGHVLKEVRDSQISWLSPEDDMDWVYRRVTDVVTTLNSKFFKFDLFGFVEGFQFTRYDAPSGHFDAHLDKSVNGRLRKLSITIQLSSPEDYEGGDLALYVDKNPDLAPKALGKLIAFPSYVLHEVLPVTKGTRYSLVTWVAGTPFR